LKNTNIKVYLIGGAPGAGKSTLGLALGARLGFASLTVDDFMRAAQAITTPETHPGLHPMRGVPATEYFTDSSVDRLKSDATAQHEATWPLIERVVRLHARGERALVIEGWHIRPRMVAQLKLDNVWSGWIVPSDSVFEEREIKSAEWVRISSNPERLRNNLLTRSLWYNDLIRRQATALQMNILRQPGETTVDELCQMVLGS
jgi:2-phosphoglycerate kinase